MLFLNVFHHFFLRPAVYRALCLNAMLFIVVLDELICAETLFTLLTVHQRIRETAQVTAGYPGLGIH